MNEREYALIGGLQAIRIALIAVREVLFSEVPDEDLNARAMVVRQELRRLEDAAQHRVSALDMKEGNTP